ncbi:hypothetical protein BDW62DRAFT_216311 [Aspergillus aurantiobrunneus]
MASYLITGTSRGLGRALAAALAALPDAQVALVFVTSRQPSAPQDASRKIVPVQLDPSNPDSLRAAVELVGQRLQGKGLDVLVNNAGATQYAPGKIEKMENLTDILHINVTQTHLVTSAFMPLLRQGHRKAIANITTTLGSISLAPNFSFSPAYAYKISKAALNMLTVQYAQDYKEEGFSVFAISPGWLRTDIGGDMADLSVETGAQAVLKYITDQNPRSLNGRFLNIQVPGYEDAPGPNKYDGKDAPW